CAGGEPTRDGARLKPPHGARPRLAEPPSSYIKRQMTLTFQEDAVGLTLLGFTGASTVMWGNDYPHHEGTWPHSREVVARLFADVPGAEARQIIHENAKKLYGFAVD